MTSTVGGLWDSLLAEGEAWWITASSDSHQVYLDDPVWSGSPPTSPPTGATATGARQPRAADDLR